MLLLAAVIGTAATACEPADHKSPAHAAETTVAGNAGSSADAASPSAAAGKSSERARQLFLDLTRAIYPDIGNRSDADLLALGDQACAGLRGGEDYDDVVTGPRKRSLSEWDAMGVITSVSTPDDGLCPDVHDIVAKKLMEGPKR